MKTDRGSGGRSAFFGLAMLILGGLLFAAGVMVGRQMALDETARSKEPLFKIDRRDQEPKKTVDGGELIFPEVLDTENPAPEPAPVPMPEIKVVPTPEAPPLQKFSLQIAAYRERSQAEDLVKKLSEKGYGRARIVAGEVAGKGMYYRVRLGPLPSRQDAQRVSKRLDKELRVKALIVLEE